MQKTTRLELNLLEKNDFFNEWHTYENANFSAIDADSILLATELVGSASAPITGLKGSASSLVDRLNQAMDAAGNIIFSDGDLSDSQHSRLADTTKIHERLEYLENGHAVGINGHAVSHFYSSDRDQSVYSEIDIHEGAVNCGSRVFQNTGTITSVGNIITVSAGWGSAMGGREYRLTRPVVFDTGGSDYGVYFSRSTSVPMGTTLIDASIIRASSNALVGVASAIKGSSRFGKLNCNIAVATAAAAGDNDNCLPSAGQTLVVDPGGIGEKQYKIKAVDTGATAGDYIDIYGEFTEDWTDAAWTIVDTTQPKVVFHLNFAVSDYMSNLTNSTFTPLMALFTAATGIEYAISELKAHGSRFKRYYGGAGVGQFATGSETIVTNMRGIENIVNIVPYVMYTTASGGFFTSYNPKRYLNIAISGSLNVVDPTTVGSLSTVFQVPTMHAVMYTTAAGYNPLVDTGLAAGTININVSADPNLYTAGYGGFDGSSPVVDIIEWGVIVELA